MERKTSNHMLAPQCASFVAKFRQVFGAENVEVLYVSEGPVRLGEKGETGATCFITSSEVEPKKKKKAA